MDLKTAMRLGFVGEGLGFYAADPLEEESVGRRQRLQQSIDVGGVLLLRSADGESELVLTLRNQR